ncbi:MAG: hypothetical protein H5T43_01405 [Methanomethylovorans sp.]|nr:hypothetical protein [Methanomethylovorans sp.]
MDLLFYHTLLKCCIVVKFRVGAIKPEQTESPIIKAIVKNGFYIFIDPYIGQYLLTPNELKIK